MPGLFDFARTKTGGLGADFARPGGLSPFADGQQIGPYEPTLRQRYTDLIADTLMAMGVNRHTSYFNARGAIGIADLTPFGILTSADDVRRAYNEGDYGGAALAALRLIPAKGGKVAARAAEELALDTASRMARAKSMGFHTGMPLYHGSDASFDAFNLATRGSTTGAAPARTGAAWLSLDPEVANEFAEKAAKSRGGNPQVYPLLHRAEKPAVVDLDGSEKNNEIAATLEDAFANGYDAVMFRNYSTSEGVGGKKVIVVRDPEQVRSIFAKFDPALKSSRNLLASLVAAGAATVVGEDRAENMKANGKTQF